MTSQKQSKPRWTGSNCWLVTTLVVASIVVSVLCGLTSCDNGCEQKRENYIHLSVTSTSGRNLQGMSILYQSGDTIRESKRITAFNDIEIDVNPRQQLTYLYIESSYTDYGDRYTTCDTVGIHYTVEPRFLDLECGCSVTYDLTEVTSTHNLFSNVRIVNREVLTDSGINIAIEY